MTMTFGGETYLATRDRSRLWMQLDRVRSTCADGKWRTLSQIAADIEFLFSKKDPQASISARLRDLRKARFGGFLVERHYVERGLFEYRVTRGGR